MPENPTWKVVLVRPGEEELSLLADLSARRNVRIAAVIDPYGDSIGAQLAPILRVPVLPDLDALGEDDATYLVHPPRDELTAPVIDAAADFGLTAVAAAGFPALLAGLVAPQAPPPAGVEVPPPPRPADLEAETAAIHRTLSRIEEALDGESLLRWLLGLATRATGASSGSVLLFDAAAEELYVGFAYGLSQHTLHRTRVRLGQGIAGKVAQTREAVCVREPQHGGQPRDRSELQSALSCPLVWEGVLLGVVNVSCDVGEAPLADAALETLESLSHRFAMILDRFERLQGVVRGAVVRELDENFALAVEGGARLEEILGIWLEDIQRLCEADSARLTLPTIDGELLVADPEGIDYPTTATAGIEEILTRGEPRVQGPDDPAGEGEGGSTLYHLPIGRDPVLAALTIRFQVPSAAHRFHRQAGEILYLLHKHLRSHLEGCRLRDEVQRLHRLAEVLSACALSAGRLGAADEERILQAARELTGAQRAFLLTAGADLDRPADPTAVLLAAARDLLARGVEPDRRATIVTVVKDPQLGHPRSLLAVPLRKGEALPGLVLADKKRLHLLDGKSFSDLDADFARRLAPLFGPVVSSVEVLTAQPQPEPVEDAPPPAEPAVPARPDFEQVLRREMDRCDRYHNMLGVAAVRCAPSQLAPAEAADVAERLDQRLRSSDQVGCLPDGTVLVMVPEDIQSLSRLKHRVGELLCELTGRPELKLQSATRVYPGGGETARELLDQLLDSLR